MNSIIKRLKETIKNYPDTLAVVEQGENNQYTYAQLGERAAKIAAKLIRLGVKPNDFVMIMLPRNKDYIASMYGVWLAGAGFAPLSPTYPPERIEYIRNDCKAKAVIDERFLHHIDREIPLTDEING